MHGVMVLTSFIIPQRREQRARNIAVILIRGGIFVALVIVVPKVAVLYAVAYLIMMHVLRFMDSVQHDYGYNTTLFEYVKPPHKGDIEWEQEHTFSNPISLRFPKLNWLVLNFGYHNAHHRDMNMPFYRLPELHRELTGNDPCFGRNCSCTIVIECKESITLSLRITRRVIPTSGRRSRAGDRLAGMLHLSSPHSRI
jgi:fatty acid desaturase